MNKKNLMEGVEIGEENLEIYLQKFEDDPIVFLKPDLKSVLTLKAILISYEVTVGLRVNFHKSTIGGIGVCERDIQRFAVLLNCFTLEMPFVYLGIPLGAFLKRIRTWEPALLKLKRKMAPWKQKVISIGSESVLLIHA